MRQALRLEIDLDLHLAWRIIEGTGANAGLFALQYGPVIYAFDLDANRDVPGAINCAFDMDLKSLAPQLVKKGDRWTARVNGHVRQADGSWKPAEITLLPFADAGEKDYFSVWLVDRARYNPNGISLFTQVHENCSRPGSNRGSFADNSTATFTSTDNGEKRDQDWFEVDAGWHTKYNVIVFRHGKSTPAGGWFDTSKGKPKILLKTLARLQRSGRDHRLPGHHRHKPRHPDRRPGLPRGHPQRQARAGLPRPGHRHPRRRQQARPELRQLQRDPGLLRPDDGIDQLRRPPCPEGG